MEQTTNKGLNTQKLLNGVIIFLILICILLFGFYFFTKKNSHILDNHIEGNEYTQLNNSNQQQSSPSIHTKFNFTSIDNLQIKIEASSKNFKIKGMENKIIFLKVFGWDCEYCKKEIPELIKLKNDLGNGFEIIAIEAQQHSKEESLAYIKEFGINYPIITGDYHQKFYDYLKIHYGWSGIIPLTIVLGENGNVLAYEIGAKSYTLAELMKASLLREKKPKL